MAIAWPAARSRGIVYGVHHMKKTIAALDDLLLRHPRSVGETYREHAAIATRFAVGMIGGGMKCLVHAVIPGLFERAASDRVRALHVELEHRRRVAADTFPDYVI